MENTTVIMSEAMDCLLKNIGSIKTEIFILNLIKEPFNYTEWHNSLFSDLSLSDFNKMAVECADMNYNEYTEWRRENFSK